jgi:hypothetical protein
MIGHCLRVTEGERAAAAGRNMIVTALPVAAERYGVAKCSTIQSTSSDGVMTATRVIGYGYGVADRCHRTTAGYRQVVVSTDCVIAQRLGIADKGSSAHCQGYGVGGRSFVTGQVAAGVAEGEGRNKVGGHVLLPGGKSEGSC